MTSGPGSRPIVELLVTAETAARIEPLVVRLGQWCDPRAPDPGLGQPAARLASSCHAAGLAEALTNPSCPVAVWLDGDAPQATVLLTDDPGAARGSVILVPALDADLDAHPPLPPAVRNEWRRRFGLPETFVVDLRLGAGPAVPPDLSETALALVSAAVVTGADALTALALGTPTVTDPDTAGWLGAVHGEHVLVAPGEAARAAADALAADLSLGAQLGLAGRRLVERQHDMAAAARTLARALGLAGIAGGTPRRRFQAQLEDLATPPGSIPSTRALAALGSVSSPGGGLR